MQKIILTITMILVFVSVGVCQPDTESYTVQGLDFLKMTQNEFVGNLASLLGDDIRGIWMMRKTDDGTQVVDEYKGNHSGTLAGGLTFTDRVFQEFGYKMVLDGIGDYIDLGDSDDYSFVGAGALDHPFSIVSLVYFNTLTGTKDIFCKHNTSNNNYEYMFQKYSSGRLSMMLGNPTSGNSKFQRVYASSGFPDTGWHLVVATYDGRGTSIGAANLGMEIYLDSVLLTSVTRDGASYTGQGNTTTKLFIGANQITTGGENFLDGDVAFSALVGNELTQNRINAIYKLVKGFFKI